LQDSRDNGDGTVPVNSGNISDNFAKERLSINVAHESAYRDEVSQAFTLRSIIKISQDVNNDKEMYYEE
jgi:hypothetical protein